WNMPEWTRELRARLASLALPPARERDIIDELSQHLDQREAELRRAGLSADRARAEALDEIADADRLRRNLQRVDFGAPRPDDDPPAGSRLGRFTDQRRRDVRYAVRTLAAHRAFAAAAIAALALGIGANSAIFAAVDAVLLRPMPFAHADRLVVPVSVS